MTVRFDIVPTLNVQFPLSGPGCLGPGPLFSSSGPVTRTPTTITSSGGEPVLGIATASWELKINIATRSYELKLNYQTKPEFEPACQDNATLLGTLSKLG